MSGGASGGVGGIAKGALEMTPGPLGSFLNGQDATQAAQNAANAQQGAANNWQNYVKGTMSDALSRFDSMTPQQLATSQEAIHGQEGNIKRQEALVSQIDPMLLEAGKQATQLLQGQAAPVLNQMKAQRADQRTQLLDNLRAQLGPGAETSTAGQQALQKFDMETSTQLNTAQQSYLGQMSGMLNQGLATRPNMAQQYGALDTLGSSLSRPALERTGVQNSFMGAIDSSYGAKMQTAGAQYMGDMLNAKNNQAIAGMQGQMAGTAVGAILGGPAGAQAGGAAGKTMGGNSMMDSLGSGGGTGSAGQGYSKPQGMYA